MPAFKSEKDKPFEDWPNIGEILIDRRGDRRLTVSEIHRTSALGRNIVGKLQNGDAYSCDVQTLLAMWERPN